MKNLLILFTGFLLSSTSFACLNVYYTKTASGKVLAVSENEADYPAIKCQFPPIIKTRRDNMRKYYDDYSSYQIKSDLAVFDLKCGFYQMGLDTLIKLQKLHPKEYTIAANLGTAYELVGEVDSAYKYIKRGYEMNKDSHYGSEYVHILILKRKVELKHNPTCDANKPIFGMDFSSIAEVEYKSDQYRKYRIREKHIIHQLRERLPFTPDYDPIVAQVLLELGDLQSSVYSIENGYKSYQLGLKFNPKNTRLISQIKKLESVDADLSPENTSVKRFLNACDT